ncbi:UNVERIFIED_CONTAM: hypothetical protein HDU68_008520 [Siphonaria sp. JEL0065]|nr:hypothetical protein HDU68_008520 [Siphonaria sp. JEL0065]
MDSLEQDLIALKIAILKEEIAKDLANPSHSNTTKNEATIGATRLIQTTNANRVVNAIKTANASSDFNSLADRMAALLDRLEESSTKQLNDQSPHSQTPEKQNMTEMIQSITLQNSQLHGLIMANMMANVTSNPSQHQHHRGGGNNNGRRPTLDYGTAPYDFSGEDGMGSSEALNAGIQSRTLLRGPSDMKRYTKIPAGGKSNRRFRIAIYLVIFVVRMAKEARLFRSYSKKVGKVLADAENQFIALFKERKSFFKAIETVCTVTKDGTSLVYKETFGNPKRKGVAVQEKAIQIGDFIVEALEKITVSLITDRLGPGTSILRAFDYLISKDIQYPSTYLWSAESRDLLDSPPYKKNPKKLSQDTARVLLLYFFAKTILLKVFTHPVDQQIVNKHNPLLETNMVAVSIFLFRGLQLACDHSGEADADEFNAGLPNGDFKTSWISPGLITAIQTWAGRLKDWSVKTFKDMDKGVP